MYCSAHAQKIKTDFNRSVLTMGNGLVPTSCASTFVCIERDQLG